MTHLWVGTEAPSEYIELQLCREFNCLPSQLRNESFEDVLNILQMMSAEAQVREKTNKKRQGKYK